MTNPQTLRTWHTPGSLSYCDPAFKESIHRSTMSILRKFAKNHLGLQHGQYQIRSNKGGIAVSGEVTLHTNPLAGGDSGIYIQISQGAFCDNQTTVLFRTCKSTKDYTGGTNNFCNVLVFATEVDMESFARVIRSMTDPRARQTLSNQRSRFVAYN